MRLPRAPEHFSLKHLETYRQAVQETHDKLEGQESVNTRKERTALQLVLAIPPAFLPAKTWKKAEDLQKKVSERDASGYIQKRQALFTEILESMESRKTHWLDYLRTGTLHPSLTKLPFAEAASKGRERLARLKARYDISGIWIKNRVQDSEGKKILRELLRAEHITPSEHRDLLKACTGGLDPHAYLQLLAEKAGVHPEEFRIVSNWTGKTIEEITGINPTEEFRKRHKIYHQ